MSFRQIEAVKMSSGWAKTSEKRVKTCVAAPSPRLLLFPLLLLLLLEQSRNLRRPKCTRGDFGWALTSGRPSAPCPEPSDGRTARNRGHRSAPSHASSSMEPRRPHANAARWPKRLHGVAPLGVFVWRPLTSPSLQSSSRAVRRLARVIDCHPRVTSRRSRLRPRVRPLAVPSGSDARVLTCRMRPPFVPLRSGSVQSRGRVIGGRVVRRPPSAADEGAEQTLARLAARRRRRRRAPGRGSSLVPSR